MKGDSNFGVVVVFLLLGIAFLGLCDAQEGTPCNASLVPSVGNFDFISLIRAEWHVQEIFVTNPEDVTPADYRCLTHDIYIPWIAIYELIEKSADLENGFPRTLIYNANIDYRDEARWHLTSLLVPQKDVVTVDTDYDNYWMQYRCWKDFSGEYHERMYILTRNNTVSEDWLAEVEGKVERYGFSLENVVKIDPCDDA